MSRARVFYVYVFQFLKMVFASRRSQFHILCIPTRLLLWVCQINISWSLKFIYTYFSNIYIYIFFLYLKSRFFHAMGADHPSARNFPLCHDLPENRLDRSQTFKKPAIKATRTIRHIGRRRHTTKPWPER